jgi:hypothetical protein
MNSSDQSLLTVLILNNFNEMKSFVFKKFDRYHLFQLSCADISERFQLFVFFLIMTSVSLCQTEASTAETLMSSLRIFTFMGICESVADIMKHAFINRFNQINSSVYSDFSHVLCEDILGIQNGNISGMLDRTHIICRRIGLSQVRIIIYYPFSVSMIVFVALLILICSFFRFH